MSELFRGPERRLLHLTQDELKAAMLVALIGGIIIGFCLARIVLT